MNETILMIHGMWGGAWNWDNYKKFFEARGYGCVAPTLRYHDMDPKGVPDSRLGTTSLLDYARDLEAEIARIPGKPVIMGHSMGGLLAQILGSRGLAKALVLLTPAAPAGIMMLKPSVIRSFASVMLKWGFWRKPHRLPFEAAVYAMYHLVPRTEQRPLYDRLVYESGRAAAEIGFWLLDPTGAARVDEAKVTCPVLVVGGGQDRITPPGVTRKIAAKYRAVSTYLELPDHAHWVLGEPGWEKVAESVAKWLEEKRSQTPQGP
jgi:non-heme chloroperoxidase